MYCVCIWDASLHSCNLWTALSFVRHFSYSRHIFYFIFLGNMFKRIWRMQSPFCTTISTTLTCSCSICIFICVCYLYIYCAVLNIYKLYICNYIQTEDIVAATVSANISECMYLYLCKCSCICFWQNVSFTVC